MTRERKRSVCHLPVLTLLLCALVTLPACNYERMYDQVSVKTYERKMPVMDKRSVPVRDGYASLAQADPWTIKNPLPYSGESVVKGRLAYGRYCVQCHGPRLDGQGTVGQSFAPLPADLTSPVVLSKPDGFIYSRIRLGFARHPALFTTVTAEEAWATVIYMRSVRGQK